MHSEKPELQAIEQLRRILQEDQILQGYEENMRSLKSGLHEDAISRILQQEEAPLQEVDEWKEEAEQPAAEWPDGTRTEPKLRRRNEAEKGGHWLRRWRREA